MKHPIGYLKKESRKTILLLCDDIRLHSGVANIAREIVIGTAHRYNWYNLGAAVKHPDEGNVFDVSEDVNNTLGIKDASVQIEGSTGYGTKEVVQKLVQNITPDIILFFTDPRYFADIFENIDTVKQDAKVFYLNI